MQPPTGAVAEVPVELAFACGYARPQRSLHTHTTWTQEAP